MWMIFWGFCVSIVGLQSSWQRFHFVHVRCIRFSSATCMFRWSWHGCVDVGNRDGRIKLFGAPGIEALLQSPLRAPCKYLEVRDCFLILKTLHSLCLNSKASGGLIQSLISIVAVYEPWRTTNPCHHSKWHWGKSYYLVCFCQHCVTALRYYYDDLSPLKKSCEGTPLFHPRYKCWSGGSDFVTSNAAILLLGMGYRKTRVGVFNKVGIWYYCHCSLARDMLHVSVHFLLSSRYVDVGELFLNYWLLIESWPI
jgi:hypothetical protein